MPVMVVVVVVEATDLLRQAQRVGSLVLGSRPKVEVEWTRVSPIGPTVTVPSCTEYSYSTPT